MIAMDSHDDNQYKLLIDTVNNNRSNKSYVSTDLNSVSECSLFPLTLLPADNKRLEGHGSSRRKCTALFKGITIEEFLEADDDPYPLTAIDKLILKNKAALVEDQMKKARGGVGGIVKSVAKETGAAPELQHASTTAANKKQSAADGAKKGSKKVISSKLANKRKNNSSGDTKKVVSGAKCNGVAKANACGGGSGSVGGKAKSANGVAAAVTAKELKKKPIPLPTVPMKKESSRTRNGVDDIAVKESQQQPMQRLQHQPQRSQKQSQRSQQQPQRSQRSQQQHQRPQRQLQQRSQQQRQKQQRPQKQQQQGKVDWRRMLKQLRGSFKKRAKQPPAKTKKPLELARLMTNLGYQTRSGNKERLRNGKSWIFHDTESLAPTKSTKRKRCDAGAPTPPPPSPRLSATSPFTPAVTTPHTLCTNPLKRIKQEPIDLTDVVEVSEKRRKLSEIKVGGCIQKNSHDNNNSNSSNDNTAVVVAPSLKASTIEKPAVEKIPVGSVQSEEVPEPALVSAAEMAPVTAPVVMAVENQQTIKCERKHHIKKEIVEEFIIENGADVVDISFIANLLGSSDSGALSSRKTAVSSNCIKSETITPLTEAQTVATIIQNGGTSNEVQYSNMNGSTTSAIRMPAMAPSNFNVGRESIVESSNANTHLSKAISRPNNDNNLTKESMFNALGLQSINKVYQKVKESEIKDKENYTGTLRAIIKTDKGCRRMEMKQKDCNLTNLECSVKESLTSPLALSNSMDKCNKSMPNSDSADNSIDDMEPLCIEDHTSKNLKNKVPLLSSIRDAEPLDKECNIIAESIKDKNKVVEPLVVPEKSSSFSIHPDRLCSDVCKYCFGKFGSLDTPCHVAQLKNEERQRKILLCEPNLKTDTCLCDACFRFVDRKANRPPKRKAMRRNSMNQRTMCAVKNCNQVARHYGKRKWRLRVGKKITNLCVDVTKSGSRVAFGLCSQHFCMVESIPSCGICKKRMKRKDLTLVQSEIDELNQILSNDGIPIKLADNALLCKYCHNCVTLRLKYGDPRHMSPNNRQYYQNFKKELLRLNNLVSGAIDDVESTNFENSSSGNLPVDSTTSSFVGDSSKLKSAHNVDIHEIASLLKPLEADHSNDKNSTHIQLKFGNLNIGKLSNLNIGQNTQPPPPPPAAPAHPNHHHHHTKLLSPGDKEMPLIADFKFETPENTPQTWEKCVSTILFDKSVKKLWQDLQQPYGNQSSFVRHLIMLEKFWRSGALVLADSAEPSAVKYINSVKNRVESLGSSTPPKSMTPAPAMTTAAAVVAPTTTPIATTATVTPTHMVAAVASSPPATKISPSLVVSLAPSPKPEASGRHHASTPPPLLKLGSYPMPMMARNSCKPGHSMAAVAARTLPGNVSLVAVKSVSTTRATPTPSPPPLTCMPPPPPPPPLLHPHQPLPPPPQLEKISHHYNANKLCMTLHQIREMVHSQSRVTHHASQGNRLWTKETDHHAVRSPPISAQKKVSVYPGAVNGNSVMRSSTVTVNFPSKQYASPLLKRSTDSATAAAAPPSMLIAKLPKALTVTQISDSSHCNKRPVSKSSAVAAPFLVGEKPSVSVFREITKK